jgi:hypothetical protein
MSRQTTIFFATDIHGSERCFLKFINAAKFFQAGVLILGGDITGKAMVPIVRQANGSSYRATFLEETSIYVHRYVLHRPLSGIFLKKYGAPRVTILFCLSLTYSFTKK